MKTGFPEIGNIFSNLPDASSSEIFQIIAEKPGVRIERIISQGQATPEGEWYDQEQDEWVLLAAGEAELAFEGDSVSHSMKPGDYLFIPAGRRHRVSWTAPDKQTVWLAVHF